MSSEHPENEILEPRHTPDAHVGAPGRSKLRVHILTVAVEDYFHATALNPLISKRHWERMESRVYNNTMRTLEYLDEFQCKATFFILGWVAERRPEILPAILSAGHEVASKGYERRPYTDHTEESFRADVRHSKAVIEDVIGRRVLGYRVPQGQIHPDDTKAFRILAEEGYVYDSSVYPGGVFVRGPNEICFPHFVNDGENELLELPLSSMGRNGVYLPVAGGNYVRQLPPPLMRSMFEWWHRRYLSPFNMYFHVWELDPELPRIATAGALTRFRQYRNIDRMPELIRYYLERYRFTSIADSCRFVQEPIERADRGQEPSIDAPDVQLEQGDRVPITIVVPCFNESRVLTYLENALGEVRQHLGRKYDVSFVLVDDCSTDDTWKKMNETFGQREDCTLVQHELNKGVAGAILTGIRAAQTEIVCSMDADCTYDPKQLDKMIPMLDDDVVMVTASPYHPDGEVVGVPEWRLFLSRNLSKMYGMVLNHSFKTYTSCFRAYRKSQVEDLKLSNTGFLGVAEMLILLDLEGKKLAECPAVLETRLLGASKLKTARVIRQHLELISTIPKLKSEIANNPNARRRLPRNFRNPDGAGSPTLV